MPYLQILGGAERGRVLALHADDILGTGTGCTHTLSASAAEQAFARVRQDEEEWWLEVLLPGSLHSKGQGSDLIELHEGILVDCHSLELSMRFGRSEPRPLDEPAAVKAPISPERQSAGHGPVEVLGGEMPLSQRASLSAPIPPAGSTTPAAPGPSAPGPSNPGPPVSAPALPASWPTAVYASKTAGQPTPEPFRETSNLPASPPHWSVGAVAFEEQPAVPTQASPFPASAVAVPPTEWLSPEVMSQLQRESLAGQQGDLGPVSPAQPSVYTHTEPSTLMDQPSPRGDADALMDPALEVPPTLFVPARRAGHSGALLQSDPLPASAVTSPEPTVPTPPENYWASPSRSPMASTSNAPTQGFGSSSASVTEANQTHDGRGSRMLQTSPDSPQSGLATTQGRPLNLPLLVGGCLLLLATLVLLWKL